MVVMKNLVKQKYTGIKLSVGSMLKMEDFIKAVRGLAPLPTEEYGTLVELMTQPVEVYALCNSTYRFAGIENASCVNFVSTTGDQKTLYPLVGGLRVAGKYPKVSGFVRGECVKPKGIDNIYGCVGFDGPTIVNSLRNEFRGYVRNPVPDAKGRIQVYAVCYIKPEALESTGTFKSAGQDPK